MLRLESGMFPCGVARMHQGIGGGVLLEGASLLLVAVAVNVDTLLLPFVIAEPCSSVELALCVVPAPVFLRAATWQTGEYRGVVEWYEQAGVYSYQHCDEYAFTWPFVAHHPDAPSHPSPKQSRDGPRRSLSA